MINVKSMFGTSKASTQTNIIHKDNENSLFGYIFKYLEVLLLLAVFFMVYSIFNVFTEYLQRSAVFISESKERLMFARNIMLGLIATKIILALCTAYFRQSGQWAYSILSTIIAFVITYYNHTKISALMLDYASEMQKGTLAIEETLVLSNWLVFALLELIGFILNSKRNKGQSEQESVPSWFTAFVERGKASFTTTPPTSVQPIAKADIGQSIGFQPTARKANTTRPKRGTSINYKRMQGLIDKGLGTKDIATVMNCSEASVRKFKNSKK